MIAFPDLLANPYASFIVRLFEMLTAHKRLPKYQFERRIDGIISLFLPGILRQVKGWNVELVVPEFPLKKALNNQSTSATSCYSVMLTKAARPRHGSYSS